MVPQNCCGNGALTKIRGKVRDSRKTPNKMLSVLVGLEFERTKPDIKIPRIEKAIELRINIFTRFMGSKFHIGETAIVTAEAQISESESILFSMLAIMSKNLAD
jgi:hypothetical protein